MDTTAVKARITEIDAEKKALYAKWMPNGKNYATKDEDGKRSSGDVKAFVGREYGRLMTERRTLVAKLG